MFRRIKIIPAPPAADRPGKVIAFVTVTTADRLVVGDIRLIRGRDGDPLVCMPARKRTEPCPSCNRKREFDARFCQSCGTRLDFTHAEGEGAESRHFDIVYPADAATRARLTDAILAKWHRRAAAPAARNAPAAAG